MLRQLDSIIFKSAQQRLHNPCIPLFICPCRVELEHLRERLASCKTVHDLFLLTEKAAYVAKTAAAACRKRAADKEPVSSCTAC
jgi:hypothetical protein